MPLDLSDPEVKEAIKAAVTDATEGLIAKRDELLGEVKKLRKGQQVDPAEVEKIESERDAARAELADAKKAATKATKDAADATAKLTAVESREQSLLKETALNDALSKANVTNPHLSKAAKAILAAQAQVVTDGDNRVVKIGDKSVTDYIGEWANTDEGKHFVTAPDNSGGGSQGGQGGAHNKNTGDMGGDKAARIARAQELLTQNSAA